MTCRDFTLLGKPVRVLVYHTARGCQVILEGGDLGHIGACALAEPGQPAQVLSLPGHKEAQVCRDWAEAISSRTKVPAAVTAGIHFNHLTPEQLSEVLQQLHHILNEILL